MDITQLATATQDKPYIGGQAVIEGVMMRSPQGISVVVRRPQGDLALRTWHVGNQYRQGLWRVMGFRGVGSLAESLVLGFRALQFSADQQQAPSEENSEARPSTGGAIWISVLLALSLFVALPQLLASGLGSLLNFSWSVQDYRFHMLIGFFKLSVLLGYLTLISRIPEMRRVFQYHGAEHKTIYNYEKGLELSVANARLQSTLHPRCGTTFLVLVVIVSIVVGATFTPLLLPNVKGVTAQLLTLALRILLLPVVAAVSYELQRFGAKFCTRGWLQVFLWPGYFVQKITTREPDDAQLEVAVASMKAALALRTQPSTNGTRSATQAPEPLRVFKDFDSFIAQLPTINP